MSHSISSDDRQVCSDFAAGRIHANAFDHRAHIRLAYSYLAEHDADTLESAASFIASNPTLLDSKIMLTHYSTAVLFSAEARTRFVEPNLELIPRHDG
jgi:hypothetical protein